ncbi:hypothetical protein AALP_AA4G176900 [Arabis alpina]|uniref:Uncharacterized protein n=1 Tax=Arabis alpina TaxID=50452 RepID=A0A087H3X8_ARAAL|nr:hypothetical protein AALP_AA4G176900 [Arabis alpina]
MAELDEELSMFLEMTRREKEQPGSKPGTSAVFHISSGGAPARKAPAPDHFLNSQGYNEWGKNAKKTPRNLVLIIKPQRFNLSHCHYDDEKTNDYDGDKVMDAEENRRCCLIHAGIT